MQSFQWIKQSLVEGKNSITTKSKEVWSNPSVQAIAQGFAAPIYTYHSLISFWDKSEDIQNDMHEAISFNLKTHIKRVLFANFIYYRMIHSVLNETSECYDSNSWSGAVVQYGLSSIDANFYLSLQLALNIWWMEKTLENYTSTSNFLRDAGRKMPHSEHFKPCSCNDTQKSLGELEGFLFFMGNRLVCNTLSAAIIAKLPHYLGLGTSFLIESASYGWPLVEYRFSLMRMCTQHRYKEILNKKMFCLGYGGSLVTATWIINKLLNTVVGAEGSCVYDSVFSTLFFLYMFMSIAREDPIPNDSPGDVDVFGMLKSLLETRVGQFVLRNVLGSFISLEEFIKSAPVAKFIDKRNDDITKNIIIIKTNLKKTKSNSLLLAVKWADKVFPFVPGYVKDFLKRMIKDLHIWIEKMQYLQDLSRKAEEMRKNQNDQKQISMSEWNKEYLRIQSQLPIMPLPCADSVSQDEIKKTELEKIKGITAMMQTTSNGIKQKKDTLEKKISESEKNSTEEKPQAKIEEITEKKEANKIDDIEKTKEPKKAEPELKAVIDPKKSSESKKNVKAFFTTNRELKDEAFGKMMEDFELIQDYMSPTKGTSIELKPVIRPIPEPPIRAEELLTKRIKKRG